MMPNVDWNCFCLCLHKCAQLGRLAKSSFESRTFIAAEDFAAILTQTTEKSVLCALQAKAANPARDFAQKVRLAPSQLCHPVDSYCP